MTGPETREFKRRITLYLKMHRRQYHIVTVKKNSRAFKGNKHYAYYSGNIHSTPEINTCISVGARLCVRARVCDENVHKYEYVSSKILHT